MFRPANPFRPVSQASRDRQTYIPPHMKKAMDEYIQHSMPAHLKKYQDENTYVPKQAANAMTEHLENNLPGHMKQYAGAYMQQRVVQPGMVVQSDMASTEPPGAGGPVVVSPTPPQSPAPSGQPANPAPVSFPAQDQPEQPSADQSYSFIMDPEAPPKPGRLASLPGGNSIAIRIGLAAGALIVLVIIFAIFRSLLGGGSDLTSLVTVAQDQQEILHLTGGALQQPGITSDNKDSAATIALAMASSQSELINYLASNHTKVKIKILNLKVSQSTDDQLAASIAAGTYNQTLQQVMKDKLDTYLTDLQRAYQQDKGKKGRALINDTYRQAQLFETQLVSPAG